MTLIVSSNLYGLYPYELATRSLLSGFPAPNRVAFTLYCVAPTNSEYRDSPSVSTDCSVSGLPFRNPSGRASPSGTAWKPLG